jgi:hypothetical protein
MPVSPSRAPLAAACLFPLALLAGLGLAAQPKPEPRFPGTLSMDPPHVSTDKAVKYDFDIVYVRAPRKSPDGRSKWAEVGDPRTMEPGADLMLLHPDGKEEVLVPVTGNESIADPQVSFDGKSVYFAKMHDATGHKGADIYRVEVATKKVTQLTHQTFTPNTGAADWSKVALPGWGVYNLGPCPLPGGRLRVGCASACQTCNPSTATPSRLRLWSFTGLCHRSSLVMTDLPTG